MTIIKINEPLTHHSMKQIQHHFAIMKHINCYQFTHNIPSLQPKPNKTLFCKPNHLLSIITDHIPIYADVLSPDLQIYSISYPMRDQPFKRFFPSDKKSSSSGYKYPTYQHYYEPKVSDLNATANAKQQDSLSKGQLQEVFASPTKKINEPPKDNPKKETSSSLKTELQHLKNQVHKIMEKKQSILRSPIQTRLNMQKPKQFQTASLEDSDNQSVSSDKIFGDARRKLQLKKSTDNYDYSKYIQLENNLLKTELRNLKNKYLNKKRELSQKCEALDQKVSFLQNALFKSEQALANEVSSLKQALREAQKIQKDIPTSDKQDIETIKSNPVKSEPQNHQSQLISEKMKSLYEDLNSKNKIIGEKQQKIDKIESELRKYKKESSLFQQKNSSILRQLQESKSSLETLIIKSQHSQLKIQKLQKINEQLTKKLNNTSQQTNSQHAITDLLQKYNQKIKALESQKAQLEERNYKNSDQLLITIEQLKFYKHQMQDKQSKIQSLTQKYQNQLKKTQQLETNYAKTMQITQKKHEELVKSLQMQIYSKVSTLTPKKPKDRDSTPRSTEKKDRQAENLDNQLKRWKIEYKILKQRHQSYMKIQNENKSQLKEYYRSFRQSRQKIQVLTHKNKLLQRQFDKYLKTITDKDAELLRKEIQLRRSANEAALTTNNNAREIIALKDRCKILQDKLNEEVQRNEKENSYRKEVQQKVFGSTFAEEGIKQIIERMKKRLLQQDQKISKSVKQVKNKQTLIQKLKQELRELMQNSEKQQSKKRTQQMNKLVQQYLSQQQTALIGVKDMLQQQKVFMEEQQKKSLDQIQELKLINHDLNKRIVDISNELRLISHSYNSKTVEMSNLLAQRSRQIQELEQRLQEAQMMAMTLESALREEVNAKNDEIGLLRKEIISKFNIVSGTSLNGTFDEVLRNQIEGNNKLKQQASKRAEEVYKLRDNYTMLRSQYENTKSQNDINKLKFLSEKKNMEVAFQIEVQNYKHVIDGWQKKVLSLEQKMKMIIQQNQKKDIFIKNFIIGKKLSQNQKQILSDFMKQFEISMGSKEIVDRLLSESKLIQNLQRYNQNLLKQIATMKEKLFLFEAIDIEKISLYESKLSRKSHQSIEKDAEQINELEAHNSRLKKAVSMQDMTPFDHHMIDE